MFGSPLILTHKCHDHELKCIGNTWSKQVAAWSMSPLLAQPLISNFFAMDLSASKKNHVPHCLPFKNPSVNRRKSHGSGCQWLLYSIPPMVKALPPQIGSCSAKQSLKLWLQSKKTSQNLNTFEFKHLNISENVSKRKSVASLQHDPETSATMVRSHSAACFGLLRFAHPSISEVNVTSTAPLPTASILTYYNHSKVSIIDFIHVSLQLHLVEVCILAAFERCSENSLLCFNIFHCHWHICNCWDVLWGRDFWSHFFASSPCLWYFCPNNLLAVSQKLSRPWAGMNHGIETHLETSQLQKAPCLAHCLVVDLLSLFETPTRFGCRLVVSISSLVQAHVFLFCFIPLLNLMLAAKSHYTYILGPCKWATAADLLPRMHSGRWKSFSDSIRLCFWDRLLCVQDNFMWGCCNKHTLEWFEWLYCCCNCFTVVTNTSGFEWQLENIRDLWLLNGWRPQCSGLWLLRLLAAEEIKDEKVNLETWCEFLHCRKAICYAHLGYRPRWLQIWILHDSLPPHSPFLGYRKR